MANPSSYNCRERSGDGFLWSKYHIQKIDYSVIASQTATNLKAFRTLFADESETEFLGFVPEDEVRIKKKLRDISTEIVNVCLSDKTENACDFLGFTIEDSRLLRTEEKKRMIAHAIQLKQNQSSKLNYSNSKNKKKSKRVSDPKRKTESNGKYGGKRVYKRLSNKNAKAVLLTNDRGFMQNNKNLKSSYPHKQQSNKMDPVSGKRSRRLPSKYVDSSETIATTTKPKKVNGMTQQTIPLHSDDVPAQIPSIDTVSNPSNPDNTTSTSYIPQQSMHSSRKITPNRRFVNMNDATVTTTTAIATMPTSKLPKKRGRPSSSKSVQLSNGHAKHVKSANVDVTTNNNGVRKSSLPPKSKSTSTSKAMGE